MSELVIKTKYATVTYEAEYKLLKLVWNGQPTIEEYKAPFLKMIDFSKTHPVESLLTDIAQQGVISPECCKWFEGEMMPAAEKVGLKQTAVVTNGNVFKIYYINLLLSAQKKFPSQVKVFNNQKDGLAWLESLTVVKSNT